MGRGRETNEEEGTCKDLKLEEILFLKKNKVG